MPPLMIKKKLNETKSFRKDFLFKFIFLTFKKFIHVHNLFWCFYSEITLSFPPNPFFTRSLPRPHRFSCVFWLGFGESLHVVGERERGEQRTRLVGIAFRSMHMRFFTGLYGPNFLELTPLRKMSPCPPSSHHLPIERREGVGFRSLAQI